MTSEGGRRKIGRIETRMDAGILTPWGRADELRERMLPPGPGHSREEVARNQRERLFGAMVACVAERGYEATTVADLLELSGVSRSAFYERFRDKEDCFLATFDAVVAESMQVLGGDLRRDSDPVGIARAALQRLFEMVAHQPAAARLCFSEAYTVGKAGHAAVERTMEAVTAMVSETLARVNGEVRLPVEIVRGLAGGGQKIIQDHLREGRLEELPGLLPDLWDWGLGYEPPPRPLKLSGRQPRSPAGERPPYVPHSQAERIIRALAAASAERGYPAVTIAEIAARASVSQATFYSHFADKDAALLAALDSAGAQMLAAMLPAGRRAPDWPHGVRAALGALCSFCAAEPDFAWMMAVSPYAAGGAALDLRERTVAGVREALRPGFELAPRTKPIVADAAIGAVGALLYMQIVDSGPQAMPEIAPLATYMVLSPFIGAEQAAEVANGDGRGCSQPAR